MEEEGKWEEQIRLKIYDFEADTNPEDWDAIAAKIEGAKIVRLHFYRRLTYIASVAAVIALLIIGGVRLFSDKDKGFDRFATLPSSGPSELDDPVVVENSLSTSVESDFKDVESETIPIDIPVDNLLASTGGPGRKTPATSENPPVIANQMLVNETLSAQKSDKDAAMPPKTEIESPNKHLAQAPTVKPRRWSFGMGGGGYTIGSTTGGAPVITTSKPLGDDEYMRDGNGITLRNGIQNSTLYDPIEGLENISQLGKVEHLLPVSAGLGISYRLTDRWSLQSGVVYTLLRSKGKYMDAANNIGEWKRNLHFIGVPISASYRIGEWNRIQFYATVGGMGEWNFTGKRKEIITVENLETIESEKIRMKEPMWSVHTRAGAVYPLWKFIYVYAETGVSYYFDNKSAIETIRSDKPFNVSLQAGIRLGF